MATTIATAPVTGASATLGVTTDLVAPYRYQWKRNGVFLPQGNDKSYVTPPLRPDDFKAEYSVVVYGQDKTEESAEVMLSQAVPKPAPPALTPAQIKAQEEAVAAKAAAEKAAADKAAADKAAADATAVKP